MGMTLTNAVILIKAIASLAPGTIHLAAALLAAILVLASACGGGNGDQAGPTSQETETATKARSSGGSDGREEPSPTPTSETNPAVTPRAGATEAVGGRVAITGRAVPDPTRSPTPEPQTDLRPSCISDFRELIAQDRGLVGRWFDMHPRTRATMLQERHNEFDLDYLNGLNVGFEASRPDCVAQGWDPKFSYGPECEGKTFRGVDITNGDLFGAYQGAVAAGSPRQGEFVWHPTRQRTDRLLIHFSRFPMSEGAGCWVGNIVSGRWGWQSADGSAHGGMNPSSAVCNGNLLIRAERLYESGWDSGEWLTGVEQYLRENRGDCPRHRLNPVREAQDGCPVEDELGVINGSGLVLHWRLRSLHPGQPVCWVGSEPTDGSDGLVWEGYDSEGKRVEIDVTVPKRTEAPIVSPPATVLATPTALAPTHTPAPQTVDICNRQESVRVAILDTLGLDGDDACEEVPEERLKQITRLERIPVHRLKGDEFYGLENLEYLSLEASTAALSMGSADLKNLKLLEITFVPYDPEEGTNIPPTNISNYADTGLEQVNITIMAGSAPPSYGAFINHRFAGAKIHIVDYRPYAQDGLTGRHDPVLHLPEVIIEFGPTDTDYQGIYKAAQEAGESRPREYWTKVAYGERPWVTKGRIDRLIIINHDTDYGISVDENFIEDYTDAPMYVELRGFAWIHKTAFNKVRGPLTLRVDPDPEGKPHRLHFSEAVETPAGTGFLPLWSSNAPYPETPECNHGLVDIAERIYQDGWDTGQWILEANRFIESNREACHTNSYVPVDEVSGYEMSCDDSRNTGPYKSPFSEDLVLYLQWERQWVHPSQPFCWIRRESSDGTVIWQGETRLDQTVEISLPEDSPYRWQR